MIQGTSARNTWPTRRWKRNRAILDPSPGPGELEASCLVAIDEKGFTGRGIASAGNIAQA